MNDKRIDILVNNAGIIMRKPAAEHPDEYWDKGVKPFFSGCSIGSFSDTTA